jgi:hypothetical protein
MALLFGGSGSGRNQPKSLVEFRAGKMTLKGTMVQPDKRKGLVYIYQSDDNLTHFCWKDRKTGTVEDDLIVFPDDCEYKKVTQCKEGSRVFLLKFKASARKLFFWMQEPKSDSDDDFVWKVNDALNNPGGSSGSNGARGGSGSGNVTPTPSDREMQALLSSMSQSQLMQLIGGIPDLGGASGLLAQLSQMSPNLGSGSGSAESGGATATASAGAGGGTSTESKGSSVAKPEPLLKVKGSSKPASGNSSSAKGPPGSSAIQLQDLQKILSNMQPAANSTDLAAGVNSEFIRRITTCPKTVQKLLPLLPQFGGPEVSETSTSGKSGSQQEVEDTLLSPQFHSALSAFCAAFPTGQLGPLVSQFDMGADAVDAAKGGNLEAFLHAIQKEVSESPTQEATGKPANEGEDMNID